MPSSIPKAGINDLLSQFPEVAAEADGWDPASVTFGSNKIKGWKCNLGHTWNATIGTRTSQSTGCPVCANKQLLVGFNDLKSKFPEIAAEADGWDPSTVIAGSSKKRCWICQFGHTWDATISNRTFLKTKCPICANKKLLRGFNDLQSKHPELSAEANGWDPSTVISGSNKVKEWKCKLGHTWNATIDARISQDSGCPVCANKQLLVGFNDLKSKFPEIAAEADGWDPSTIVAGSHQRMNWVCCHGHRWKAPVKNRTSKRSGCPVCANKQVNAGFNDLKSRFPEIAEEAYGWDPSTVVAGSSEKKTWICQFGHTWDAIIVSRTSQNNGCPVCSNQQLLVGYNDLQTRFPEIAKEADGWDPSTVIAGSGEKKSWICNKGHCWDARITDRTARGRGCPSCAEYGFNPEKDAWFYLMHRPGEQQIGITNNLEQRTSTHRRGGWETLDWTKKPMPGSIVLETERALKKWLKEKVGVIEGTTENWATTTMEVQSLAELKARSGIKTDLF